MAVFQACQKPLANTRMWISLKWINFHKFASLRPFADIFWLEVEQTHKVIKFLVGIKNTILLQYHSTLQNVALLQILWWIPVLSNKSWSPEQNNITRVKRQKLWQLGNVNFEFLKFEEFPSCLYLLLHNLKILLHQWFPSYPPKVLWFCTPFAIWSWHYNYTQLYLIIFSSLHSILFLFVSTCMTWAWDSLMKILSMLFSKLTLCLKFNLYLRSSSTTNQE